MNSAINWMAALAVVLAVGGFAAHTENEADRQDAEALSSRDFAGRSVCGSRTPVWLDDKTLECLKETP